MNTITQTDRRGKTWTFTLDCNPSQERMFSSVLSFAHNIGWREERLLTYYNNKSSNVAFQEDLENVILSALEQWVQRRNKPTRKPNPEQMVITYCWKD